jgi:hypothetical protein
MIGELVRRVVDVDAWAREAADLRALLARRISPVSEAGLETCAQLAEASARVAYLEGVVDSLQVEAAKLREAARARIVREEATLAEAARDRVGEALARFGVVSPAGRDVDLRMAWETEKRGREKAEEHIRERDRETQEARRILGAVVGEPLAAAAARKHDELLGAERERDEARALVRDLVLEAERDG